MARCKSCGAEILWVRTTAGKPMPVDLAVTNVMVRTEKGDYEMLIGHQSHFATGPDADKWRKG